MKTVSRKIDFVEDFILYQQEKREKIILEISESRFFFNIICVGGLGNLRDVPANEQPDLFCKKLQLCMKRYDFYDIVSIENERGKMLKTSTLIELREVTLKVFGRKYSHFSNVCSTAPSADLSSKNDLKNNST